MRRSKLSGKPDCSVLLKLPYSAMEHCAWVYILTNRHHTTLYVGVTNNLPARLYEHRTKQNPKSFTARYNVYKLVYYEGFESIVAAIAREKFIKRKTRKWKEDLIKTMNAGFTDLSTLSSPPSF
jgi:putative endonuclease